MDDQNRDEPIEQNNLLRDDLPETSFSSRIQDEIMVARDYGKAMTNDTMNLNRWAFASETSKYSLNVRQDLMDMADNSVENQVAELASYRVKQELRSAGLLSIEPTDELPIDEESAEGLTAFFVEGFIQSDVLSDSSNLNIGKSISPFDNLEELLEPQQWEKLETDAAKNYLENRLVHDEDWISYLSGENTRYDAEVRGYLEDIGFSDM